MASSGYSAESTMTPSPRRSCSHCPTGPLNYPMAASAYMYDIRFFSLFFKKTIYLHDELMFETHPVYIYISCETSFISDIGYYIRKNELTKSISMICAPPMRLFFSLSRRVSINAARYDCGSVEGTKYASALAQRQRLRFSAVTLFYSHLIRLPAGDELFLFTSDLLHYFFLYMLR